MAGVSMSDYRTLMSCFPTGVTVITAVDPRGTPHGMTCTSLTSVTIDPPTLLVCLNVQSGTLGAIRETGVFALNFLHQRGRPAAELFSSPVADRFSRVCWRPSDVVRCPWLFVDAFALAECRVTGTFPAGDHDVVLGEVVGVRQTDGVPLLYGMRQFSAWSADASDLRAVASASVSIRDQ